MSVENWDNRPEPRIHRQQINDFLNHLFNIETDSNNQSVYIPAAEIKETAIAFYIKLEIPGITKRKINLDLTSISVIIRGERTFIKDAEEKKQVFSDFHYGKWQRIISLPVPITFQGAIAEYADGVLKLILYKQISM